MKIKRETKTKFRNRRFWLILTAIVAQMFMIEHTLSTEPNTSEVVKFEIELSNTTV